MKKKGRKHVEIQNSCRYPLYIENVYKCVYILKKTTTLICSNVSRENLIDVFINECQYMVNTAKFAPQLTSRKVVLNISVVS